MGNVFGRPQANARLNIPVHGVPRNDAAGINDMNRPVSAQMLDMCLQYAVPLMCIALVAKCAQIAIQDKYHREQLKRMKEVHQHQIREMTQQMETIKTNALETMHLGDIMASEKHKKSINDLVVQYVIAMENEVEKEQQPLKKISELYKYQTYFEEILDIKCSPFKLKDDRKIKEHQLWQSLDNDKVGLRGLGMVEGVNAIIEHDDKFCGRKRSENGRLRFLYEKLWTTQIERDKYKSIVLNLKKIQNANEE